MKYRSLTLGRVVLTGVTLAASFLTATDARALGLGRLAVQSALGEPLRVEIDVTSLTPEEASTLKVRVASPEAYRAAGIDYNSVLQGTQVSLQSRPDGRRVVSVVSDRPVLEPFMDVIVELNWASGRVVRNYTLLLDPPNLRQTAPATVATAPAISAALPPSAVTSARPVTTPASPASASARAAPARVPAAKPADGLPTPAASAAADAYRVRPGDSLSRIAARTQRGGVSLEQMLVSLYRANPGAFMDGNMNRLKAGAVLAVPSAEAVQQVTPVDAHRVIVAQSSDFGAYRQRLAAGVPAAGMPTSPRQASGKLSSRVEEPPQAVAGTDRLTLSPGAAAAEAASGAKAGDGKDAATRVAEVARNLETLKQLQGTAAASAVTAAAAPAPLASVMPASASASASASSAQAAASRPAESEVASAPQGAASARPARPPIAPPQAAGDAGFLMSLLDNPLVLPALGLLVALLAGLGIYRLRGRGRRPVGETSFLESHASADSLFGAGGAQRIDPSPTRAPSSTAAAGFSISQLDVIGEVDAVAEADVYLAYGRDLQAEEILKEALRATPDRLAVRAKLLEVYAKRRDIKGFESLAVQLYALTRGEGEYWAKAQESGRQLDPDNPLYRPGGKPAVRDNEAAEEPLGATTMPLSVLPVVTKPPLAAPGKAAPATLTEVDIELDLNADEAPPSTTRAPEGPSTLAPLDFDLGDLTLDLDGPASPRVPSPPAASAFDLSSLSLDPVSRGQDNDGSLSRQLDRAEALVEAGDRAAALPLLREVLARAEGALKADAQHLLDRLGAP